MTSMLSSCDGVSCAFPCVDVGQEALGVALLFGAREWLRNNTGADITRPGAFILACCLIGLLESLIYCPLDHLKARMQVRLVALSSPFSSCEVSWVIQMTQPGQDLGWTKGDVRSELPHYGAPAGVVHCRRWVRRRGRERTLCQQLSQRLSRQFQRRLRDSEPPLHTRMPRMFRCSGRGARKKRRRGCSGEPWQRKGWATLPACCCAAKRSSEHAASLGSTWGSSCRSVTGWFTRENRRPCLHCRVLTVHARSHTSSCRFIAVPERGGTQLGCHF